MRRTQLLGQSGCRVESRRHDRFRTTRRRTDEGCRGGRRPGPSHGGRRRRTATGVMCFPPSSPMAANSSTCRGRRTRCGSGRWIRARPRASSVRNSQVLYADGHLLFARQGTLLARPFDASTGDARGRSDGGCRTGWRSTRLLGAPAFSSSETGVLVYRTGAASSQTQLTWVDRSGHEIGKVGPVGSYRNPDVIGRRNARRVWKRRIPRIARRISRFWSWRAARPRGSPSIAGTTSTPSGRPTTAASRSAPIGSGALYNLYQKMASGAAGENCCCASTGDNLTGPAPSIGRPTGSSCCSATCRPKREAPPTSAILPLSGDRTISVCCSRRRISTRPTAQISPDGRWVAYNSGETGRKEVYVASFPTPEARGRSRMDGAAFRAGEATAGSFSTMRRTDGSWRCPSRGRPRSTLARRFRSSAPAFLAARSTVTGFRAQYDVTADGQRFLLNVPVDETPDFPADHGGAQLDGGPQEVSSKLSMARSLARSSRTTTISVLAPASRTTT